MNKMRSYFGKNIFQAKIILAVLVICFAAAPMVYAQFARQTGDDTGWGYGYGYGYGLGYGYDEGAYSGYRTGGGSLDSYAYGYGYGYLGEGVSYDAELGFQVTESNFTDLVLGGVITADGGDATDTTEITFADLVTLDIGSGEAVITIPSGTTFTSSTSIDFSALASAVGTVSGLAGVNVQSSSITLGISGYDLTVAPALTIPISVGTEWNGTTMNVYRRDAAGWDTTAVTTCTVSGGICSFTTTHLSSFAAGYARTASGSTGGSGGGAFIANTCASVSYNDWGACVGGLQFRSIAIQSPSGCTVSGEQQLAGQRACGAIIVDPVTGVIVNTTESMGSAFIKAVMDAERALVSKANTALTKRLSGRILLQVEEKGQAWYLEPMTMKKHYMGRPADAFDMMRRFGLGINEANFATFEKSGVPAKFSGRIFLRVASNGEAYYVNPVNMKMYYLGRPDDALRIMRELALGINNANIRQIPVAQ